MPRYTQRPQQGVGIAYTPQYDPGFFETAGNMLQQAQQQYDMTTAAQAESMAQYGQEFSFDPELRDEMIGKYKESLSSIVEDYGGDVGAARNKIVRRMGEEATNPFWQANRYHVEQAKIAQEAGIRLGANALWINDPRNPEALRKALETGDMSALETRVAAADDYTKIGSELMSRITKDLRDDGMSIAEIQGVLVALKTGQTGGIDRAKVERVANAMLEPFKAATSNRQFDNRPGFEWTQDDSGIIEFLSSLGEGMIHSESRAGYQVLDHAFKTQAPPQRLEDNIFFDTFTGVGESATDRGVRRINKDWSNLRAQASLVRAPGTQSYALDQSVNKAQQLVGDVLGLSEKELTSNLNQIQRDLRRGKGEGNLLISRLFGTRERDNSLLQNDPEQLNELVGLVHNYLTLKYPEYAETGKLPVTGWGDLPTPIEMSDDGSLTVPRRAQASFASYLTEVLTERELLKADKSYEDMFKDQPLIQQEVFNGNMTLDEAVNFGQANELAKYMTFSTSVDIPDPNAVQRLITATRQSFLGASNIDGEARLVSSNRRGDMIEDEIKRTRVSELLGDKDRDVFGVTITPYDNKGNTTINFHTTIGGKDEIIRVPGKTGSNETKLLIETLNSVMEGLYGHNTDRTVIELPDSRRVLIRKQFVRSPYTTEQGLEVPGMYDTRMFIEVPYYYPDRDQTIMQPEEIQPSEITEELIKAIMLRSGQRVQQKPVNY